MLWIEMTPKTVVTPSSARVRGDQVADRLLGAVASCGGLWRGPWLRSSIIQMCRETPPETSRLAPVM